MSLEEPLETYSSLVSFSYEHETRWMVTNHAVKSNKATSGDRHRLMALVFGMASQHQRGVDVDHVISYRLEVVQ